MRPYWEGQCSIFAAARLVTSDQAKPQSLLSHELVSLQLIAAGHWPRLATLNISRNGLTADDVAALAKGDWPALTALDVSHNMRSLTRSLVKAAWTALQQLNLTNDLTPSPEDISALQARDWPQLTRLEMGFISPSDLRPIQQLREQKWPQLAYLGLYSNLMPGLSSHNYLGHIDHMNALFSSLEHLDLTPPQYQSQYRRLPLAQLDVLLLMCGPSLCTLRVWCFANCPIEQAHKLKPEHWPLHTKLDLAVRLDVAILDSFDHRVLACIRAPCGKRL